MTDPIIIYTDGACKGNPGAGGWGVFMRHKHHKKEFYGGEPETTNNRMELMAAIMALEALKMSSTVELHSDSKYLLQGITEWMQNWKKKGWKTAAKKPVKNVDLWQRLDLLVAKHQISWVWVKGHSGNLGNEKADELANKGVPKI